MMQYKTLGSYEVESKNDTHKKIQDLDNKVSELDNNIDRLKNLDDRVKSLEDDFSSYKDNTIFNKMISSVKYLKNQYLTEDNTKYILSSSIGFVIATLIWK